MRSSRSSARRSSHEDDAERALLVALEMHRRARATVRASFRTTPSSRCTAASTPGHGIARILGSDARMDYAVLGDSVILAQRLEFGGTEGETYVSDLTYRLTSDCFDFQPVGELTLKGKSEAVIAWRLLGERAASDPLGRRAVALSSVVRNELAARSPPVSTG